MSDETQWGSPKGVQRTNPQWEWPLKLLQGIVVVQTMTANHRIQNAIHFRRSDLHQEIRFVSMGSTTFVASRAPKSLAMMEDILGPNSPFNLEVFFEP